MPVYEYRCRNCGYEFDKFLRTFETGDVNCPSCQSANVEKLLSPPVIRMGKISSGPSSEYSAKSEEVDYYKDRKDYERAAKEIAAQTGLSEEAVVAKAAEGALLAAEVIGPEAVAQVAESLPEDILPLDIKEDKT